MCLVLLKAVYKPIHHHQLIGRRKVSLNHTSAACRLHGGGIVSFSIVTGGIPPVSVASHMLVNTFYLTGVFSILKKGNSYSYSQDSNPDISFLHNYLYHFTSISNCKTFRPFKVAFSKNKILGSESFTRWLVQGCKSFSLPEVILGILFYA